MSKAFKKLLAAATSALIGLILLPVLAVDFSFRRLPLLISYFLPGFCIGLVILFELLTRIPRFLVVYRFIRGAGMIVLFLVLLLAEWIIMWQVDPPHDVVFTAQFATAAIPAIWMYAYLGKRMNFLK